MNGTNEGEGKQMMAFQFCPNEQKDPSAGESTCTDGFVFLENLLLKEGWDIILCQIVYKIINN